MPALAYDFVLIIFVAEPLTEWQSKSWEATLPKSGVVEEYLNYVKQCYVCLCCKVLL